MKLIKKSKITDDTIEIKAERGLAAKIMFWRPSLTQQFIGRRTFGNCFIQYDFMLPGGEFPIAAQKEDIIFEDQLYHGVFPVRHHGHRVYECKVDAVSVVRVGTINLVE